MSTNNNRIVFIDYIRVVACFLVLLVHSCEVFYAWEGKLTSEANRLWVSIYDGVFGRISVPLFMVVSAFLLAPMRSGTTMSGFYRHRFQRILPPMIFFLLLYVFLPPLWGTTTWEQAMRELTLLPFTFPSQAGHLWFMYPLISLYLIIPVVSPWLERSSAHDERIFIGLFVLSTFVPFISRFVSADVWGTCFWNPYFGMLYYCSGYLGYLVLAHYIRKHLTWNRRRRLTVGTVCLLIGSLFTGWSFWYAGEVNKVMELPMLEWGWEFCTPNVLLSTFGAFLLFTCIERKTAPRLITTLSKLSFGMYLMHIFFLNNIALLFIPDGIANPIVHPALAIPCIAILTFICCAVTTKLVSLLPGSKWLIG